MTDATAKRRGSHIMNGIPAPQHHQCVQAVSRGSYEALNAGQECKRSSLEDTQKLHCKH